jgi:hypothetical protein
VKGYAGENLVTVRGGDPVGGGGHLHSHLGREEIVIRSIISWIKTKKARSGNRGMKVQVVMRDRAFEGGCAKELRSTQRGYWAI